MQTRRDQLQAYRFQNRRALAALVKGEPNVLEPPMRRLTVMTLSGIMIAILIGAGFAALGLIHPSAGNSWKNSQAVIVDNDTASTYVYLHGTLHPTLNFTSAVLAVAGNGSGGGTVPRVTVSSGDIAKARYGAEIGIQQVPSALPPADGLLGFPLSVCSVQRQQSRTGAVNARVTMTVATDSGGSSVPSDQGVVIVAADEETQRYLLLDGRRLPIPAAGVAALNLGSQPPLVVGTSFVNSVPLGPTLAAPSIPQDGRTAAFSIGGQPLRVGTIATTAGAHGASYLVLSRGFVTLTAFERALFVGNPTRVVSQQSVGQHLSTSTLLSNAFVGLPSTAPTLDTAAATRAGVCAVYSRGGATPRVELARQARPEFGGVVGQSATARTGYADKVSIPATKGVLATPADNPRTVVFVSDQGRQYAFASSALITAFGYARSDVTPVPAALLKLIPPGPGLRTGAARERVTLR